VDVDRYVDRWVHVLFVDVVMDEWRGMEYINVNRDKNQGYMDGNVLETRSHTPKN
jgi:hypothetical protein